MSIFSLTPWFLTSMILSVIFFMIVGMIMEEKRVAIAFMVICGITFGSVLNMGINYNAYIYDQEIAAESNMICLKAEKTHLINTLKKIEKIQISNDSDHIEYTQYHINELENTGEFLLSINIDAAKEAIEYIQENPWLLK